MAVTAIRDEDITEKQTLHLTPASSPDLLPPGGVLEATVRRLSVSLVICIHFRVCAWKPGRYCLPHTIRMLCVVSLFVRRFLCDDTWAEDSFSTKLGVGAGALAQT